MKTLTSIVAAACLVAGLGACQSPGERAVGGALIGGAGGALIGGAIGGGRGAAVGAAIGAASGAIVGAGTAPERRCVRGYEDEYGEFVCTRSVPNT